jgi:ERCC4-related helicase
MKFLEGITPRKYQEEIYKTCIEKNCLVVLPTGLGKTLIALMITITRMQQFPGEKVVFLAPTKPLAEQHINSFKKYLPELFAEMDLFTGAINAEKRKKIWQNADIIFSTPQCVANDLKKGLYNLNDVCLLIEDEAHRCVKNYDYNLVAQKYRYQAENQRIVGLTASPGHDTRKIKQICKNLAIEEVELRSRESDDVKEYLQTLEFEKVMVDFPKELQDTKYILMQLFDEYVDELRMRKVLFGPATKTGLIMLQKKIMGRLSKGMKDFNYMLGASACAQAIKIQHALELLETQTIGGFHLYLKNLFDQAAKQKSKGVVKLVKKPEFNLIFSQSNALIAKNIEHPKVNKLKEIIEKEQANNEKIKIIVFTQFRDTASIIAKNLNQIENIKADVFVGQAKKNGLGMNQKAQKQMIADFSEGKINVLCATSIAEEGLDIPEVNAVIFYEPIPSAIRSIQRAGRTARLKEGKLIILITRGTRDETFFYVSRAREKGMHSAIESIKKDLSKGNLYKKTEKQKSLF